MAEISNIKACVFDAYGTLFDVHAAAAACRDMLGDKADRLSAIWRQKQLEYTWLRSLMGAYEDFWRLTQDGLDYAMETVEIDDPHIRETLLGLYWELSAYEEVPTVLSQLQQMGLKTVILSNGSPDMLNAAVKSAGISDFLDGIHSVSDVGIFKPDPRVYQMTVDKLNIAPSEICFMSSNAWDAAGAAYFGYQVVWINRFGQTAERLPGKPQAVLSSLHDLPALLK